MIKFLIHRENNIIPWNLENQLLLKEGQFGDQECKRKTAYIHILVLR